MSTITKHNVSFLLVFVLGVSMIILGCGDKGTNPDPLPTPTPEPQVTARTLMNNSVSLNGNATCSNGWTFCADRLSFVAPELENTVTVRVSGPANLDPDVVVFNSAGGVVASGYSGNGGLEVVTFTPNQVDVYWIRVHDYNNVGGSVNVTVTQ